MRQPVVRVVVCLVLLWCTCAVARAADLRFYTLSLVGGLGSALDEDASDLGNRSIQGALSFETSPSSRLGLRIGRLRFRGEALNDLPDPNLTYLTVAGEIRFKEAIYDSGLYIGLGPYRMRSRETTESDDRLGLSVGYTGEFEVSERISVALELTGHYVDFREHRAFMQLMAGLAWHF